MVLGGISRWCLRSICGGMTYIPPIGQPIISPVISGLDYLFGAPSEVIDDTLDKIVEYLSRVLFSGSTLVFSAPEYYLESIVQLLFPITDPFMRPIPAGSSRAETECLGLGLFSGTSATEGWVLTGTEQVIDLPLISVTVATSAGFDEVEVSFLISRTTNGTPEYDVTSLLNVVVGYA